MLRAKEVISPTQSLLPQSEAVRSVDAAMPVVELLPLLLDAPGRVLNVQENGEMLGVVDSASLLEGLGKLIAPRDDSSLLTVECSPEDYSASHLARAVEDADAHLVDLWSSPAENGKLRVTLRVRHSDPTPAAHSLERYGYEVVECHGHANADLLVAQDRLKALQLYLNV